MGRPRKDKKSKFDDLPEEFKSAMESSNCDEIRLKVCQVSLDQVELNLAKELDQDLAEKAEAYKEAGAMYREGSAMNKLKIAYMKEMLEAKGDSKTVRSLNKFANDIVEKGITITLPKQ